MAGGEWSRENGKKGGRPRLEATKLREALIRQAEERADELAKVLMDKAITGDIPAIKEMIDRGIGKAVQPVNLDTPPGLDSIVLNFTKPHDDTDAGQGEGAVRAP